MTDYITIHLRDGKEISRDEWNKLFKKDLDIENEKSTWNIIQTVYADLGNGRDMDLNGHLYQRKTNVLYDNAKELLEDLIMEDGACVVLDMLREMPETELFNLLSKVDRIDKHDGKLLLKYDEED